MTNPVLVVIMTSNNFVQTDFSLLDGFGQIEAYAEKAIKNNQKFLTVTDHGMMGAVPRQLRACEVAGLTPVLGIEAYLNNMHMSNKEDMKDLSPEERKEVGKNYHLLMLAYTNKGYSNLVQLSSQSWLQFYKKPRVTYEQIDKHKEGVIFTSSCYIGEIGQAFDRYGPEIAEETLKRYIKWFEPNFYLELMLLDFKKQRAYDAWLIKMHEKYHTPLILSTDTHYPNKEDSQLQRYMLMIRGKKTVKDFENLEDGQDYFELQDTNLWMKSEEELDEKYWKREEDGFSYSDIIPYELYTQGKINSVEIARKCSSVEIDRKIKLPEIPDADIKFKEAVFEGYRKRGLGMQKKYLNRLKEEIDLICKKGFSSYFIIQQEIVKEARRKCPELIGWGNGDEALSPGRGCLSSNSRIVMSDGLSKCISDVNRGDKVITRDGSVKVVKETLVYDCAEKLLNITTFCGDKEGVSLTKDHKVLVNKDWLKWIPASETTMDDWLFVPRSILSEKIISKGDVDNYKLISDGLLVKIKEIKEVESNGKVYDLSISGNHNYLTTSFLVHNSLVGSLVCYCLGFSDVDPIHHDLLFSRFLSENRGGRSLKTRFTDIPIPEDEEIYA